MADAQALNEVNREKLIAELTLRVLFAAVLIIGSVIAVGAAKR